MNLMWHIIWKDARRLRWPLAAWAGLIVVQLLIGAWMVAQAGFDLEKAQRLADLLRVLLGMQLLSAYLMVAWLVHEDLVVGIRSHWMTLPISGGRLCAAKLSALALFFWVLPCVLALPWWLSCGFGLREIGWAALQTMALHAAVTLPVLPIAVLTDNWTRFFTWTLVLVFALVTGSVLMMATVNAESGSASGGIQLSRVLLVLGIWLVTIVAVTVHQFVTRRTGRSIGLAATGVVGAVAILGGWSHDLSPRLRQMVAPWEVPLWHNAVVVEAGSGESMSGVVMWGHGIESRAALQLRLKVMVDDLAGRENIRLVDLDAEWRWADGISWKKHAPEWGRNVNLDAENAALVNPTGAVRARREYDWGSYVSGIPPSLAAKMLAAPPMLRGKVAMQVYRREIVGEYPLTAGTRFAEGAQTIRILRCDPPRSWRLNVVAMFTGPQSITDDVRRWIPSPSGSTVYLDRDWLRRSALAVRKGATRDATDLPHRLGWVDSYTTSSTVISGVEISRRQLTIWQPRLRKPEFLGVPFRDLREKFGLKHVMDAYEPDDPDWYDDAKLVSMRFTAVGRIETSFQIERFEVRNESISP